MPALDLDSTIGAMGTISAIASDSGPVNERGGAVLAELKRIIPFEAAEICSINPLTGESVQIASEGYSDQVLSHLHSKEFHDLMELLGIKSTGRPIRMQDLPGDPMDNWAVADVLYPAGYAEGLTMCLRTPDGRVTGVINLSTLSTDHPSDIARDAVAHLCATLGNLADPLQSGKWIAMLLGAGSMAIGLDGAGSAISIPGLTGHKLLTDGTELLEVAKGAAVHNSWGSFVWSDDDDWFRVRVVPCKGEQPIMTVVSMDSIDIGPLSRRELEVLTLAAEGLSNQEIGDALVISNRTVASHVEHILDKLSAPNRAAAAAYALREGLILGRVVRYDR
jgi:DNA-binding CsgD family transcriptional regulator